MRTSAAVMRARLSRLERLAGRGRCPCRLFQRKHTWCDPTRAPAEPGVSSLIVIAPCEFCGTTWRYDLSGYPEEVREVPRLYYVSGLEDLYTDPRVRAAQHWMGYWAEARSRTAPRGARSPPAPAHSTLGSEHYERRRRDLERARAREKDPDVKRWLGLLAQSLALIVPRLRRLERRYGKNPFPDVEALVAEFGGPDDGGTPEERQERARQRLLGQGPPIRRGPWFVCAEMEKIILGGVSAYTAAEVEECERRELARIAQIRAQEEQLTEMLRQREEERERQRRGRHAAAPRSDPPPPPAAPDSPPAPAAPRPRPAGGRASLGGGMIASTLSPAPPRNAAPTPPAHAAFAPPRRPPAKPPKTLRACHRLLAENERRRRP